MANAYSAFKNWLELQDEFARSEAESMADKEFASDDDYERASEEAAWEASL
jgi:hypothetical protein